MTKGELVELIKHHSDTANIGVAFKKNPNYRDNARSDRISLEPQYNCFLSIGDDESADLIQIN